MLQLVQYMKECLNMSPLEAIDAAMRGGCTHESARSIVAEVYGFAALDDEEQDRQWLQLMEHDAEQYEEQVVSSYRARGQACLY